MFNFLLQGKVGEMMAPVQSQEAQLLIAIQNRQQEKIRELLEVKGVGANNANDRGVRPMHVACQSGNSHLVQRLLELGADIVTADKAGNTPLHYAAKGGHTDVVKMLVGQGAAVERRNGSKLTAYDVAKDHVIRQFLLPLQLKAEAGNPEYAVHTMGITSDAPRDYQQYGVPGMSATGSSGNSSQAYGHQQGGVGRGGSDSMDAALGALMQAPSMGPLPPRPGGGMAPPTMGMAPPGVYPGAGGYSGGTPPQQQGSYSPPGDSNGVGVGGFAAPTSAFPPAGASSLSSSSPPTAAASAAFAPPPPPLPTPGAGATSSTALSSPPSPPPPPPAAAAAPVSSSSPAPPSGAGVSTPTRPESPLGSAVADGGSGGPRSFSGVAVQLVPSPTPAAAAAAAAAASTAEDGAEPSSPLEDEGMPRGGVVATPAKKAGEIPAMSTVDLSSKFQAQVAVSGGGTAAAGGGSFADSTSSGAPETAILPPPPGVHPISVPNGASTGTTAPPPPRTPGAYAPGPGMSQAAPEQTGKKFKLIKPDGFHSSASDKVLQARYGHTKIVKEFGAPPTAAQLGGAGGPPLMGGGGHMAGPAMPHPNSGYARRAQPPPHYAMPPHQQAGGHARFGQPFGGGVGGGGGGGMGAMQQPFGAPPPHPPAAPQGYPPQQLPMPGDGGAGSAPGRPPFSPGDNSVARGGGQGRGGGYGGAFNPTTTVVAADSTSSAVL